MGSCGFQEMHELTPISTNLEKFSHNIFLNVAVNISLMPCLKDLNKSSMEIIWLHQTAILALLYIALMDQTNQSLLVIPYKIRVWHSESKMQSLSLSGDLHLCSRRGSCIRTLLRKLCLM